jgi:hypothetical protein
MIQRLLMEYFELDAKQAKQVIITVPLISATVFGLIFIITSIGYLM